MIQFPHRLNKFDGLLFNFLLKERTDPSYLIQGRMSDFFEVNIDWDNYSGSNLEESEIIKLESEKRRKQMLNQYPNAKVELHWDDCMERLCCITENDFNYRLFEMYYSGIELIEQFDKSKSINLNLGLLNLAITDTNLDYKKRAECIFHLNEKYLPLINIRSDLILLLGEQKSEKDNKLFRNIAIEDKDPDCKNAALKVLYDRKETLDKSLINDLLKNVYSLNALSDRQNSLAVISLAMLKNMKELDDRIIEILDSSKKQIERDILSFDFALIDYTHGFASEREVFKDAYTLLVHSYQERAIAYAKRINQEINSKELPFRIIINKTLDELSETLFLEESPKYAKIALWHKTDLLNSWINHYLKNEVIQEENNLVFIKDEHIINQIVNSNTQLLKCYKPKIRIIIPETKHLKITPSMQSVFEDINF